MTTQISNPPTQTPHLTAHQLFFDLQAVDPLRLHAHNGSALRGMVYRAVAELATGDQRAPDLRFVPDPAIQRLLAALDDDNPRGKDLPRPYVIDPPMLPSPPTYQRDDPPKGESDRKGHTLAPGGTFSFGITLFGEAMEAFPILVMAMKHAEERGLGRTLFFPLGGTSLWEAGGGGMNRGRFRVLRALAQNPLTRTSQEFLAPGERMVMTPQVCITHDDVMRQAELDASEPSRQLRLHLHTPMTLKVKGEPIRQPDFSVLIHRLIERLTRLSTEYGGALLPCLPADRDARNALLHLADSVRLVEDQTRWAEVRGFSDRTVAPTNLSGLTGTADFGCESEIGFAPFFPILRWGEIAHAGNNTVKGNGLFRMQMLN